MCNEPWFAYAARTKDRSLRASAMLISTNDGYEYV